MPPSGGCGGRTPALPSFYSPIRNGIGRPVVVEAGDVPGGQPKVRPFEWTTLEEVGRVGSARASAGEFDLLDGRSLMERGDYTGAVRRTVTAIEALVRAQLVLELAKTGTSEQAESAAAKTDNDFPG